MPEPVAPPRALPPVISLPHVVSLPSEIDAVNAGCIGAQLAGELLPGAGVVIADMSATTFCDTTGIRMLILARRQAAANGTDLRLLLPTAAVLEIMKIHGADAVLPIYMSLEQALRAPGRCGHRLARPSSGSPPA